MLQDEDYDSDTSDEDFIPEGAESEDDPISGGEEEAEDDDDDDDGEGQKKPSAKEKKKGKKKKGKKQNPLLAHVEKEEEEVETEQDILKEEKDKKKEENLWADFLADVEDKPSPPPKPKASSWAALLGKKTSGGSDTTPAKPITPSVKKEGPKKEEKKTDKPSTVKITKVFEFAGEEVRIEKEVDANSAEAKAAAITNEGTGPEEKKEKAPTPGVGGVKRPAGLSSIIGFLDNKKQKLSTLEKTKLDWNNFKSEEGLDEELESHKKSKDGYLDKQAFLERADLRQFEIERAMRQSKKSNR